MRIQTENISKQTRELLSGCKSKNTSNSSQLYPLIQLHGDRIAKLLSSSSSRLSERQYMKLACQWSELDSVLINAGVMIDGESSMGCPESIKPNSTQKAEPAPAINLGESGYSNEVREFLGILYNNVFVDGNRDLETQGTNLKQAYPEDSDKVDFAVSEFKNIFASDTSALPAGGGLRNLGATCYLNTGLQLLRRFPGIHQHLAILSEDRNNQLALALREIYAKMDAGSTIDRKEMESFFNMCQCEKWEALSSAIQEDSMEFVRWLVAALNLQQAPMQITRSSSESDGRTSITHQDALEIPSFVGFESMSAQRLFDASLTDFAEDSGIVTSDTFKGPAPNFFVQSFKRMEQGTGRKLGAEVDFSEGLTLKVAGKDVQYEPISLTLHLGESRRSGHYVNYSQHQDGSWNCYNDESNSSCSNINAESIQKNVTAIVWRRV